MKATISYALIAAFLIIIALNPSSWTVLLFAPMVLCFALQIVDDEVE